MTSGVAIGDTIVAIATAAGTAAVGMIRLSGPRAVEIASQVVHLKSGELSGAPPRMLRRVNVVDPSTGHALDIGLAVRMPAPNSYTGEDVVELSCHGNPVLLQSVLRCLVGGGARLAEPGEFTRRAYLNGRLGLLEAEAVAVIIAARSERAVRLAARQLHGGMSQELHALRDRVLDLVALLEVSLDFPDDVADSSRDELGGRVSAVLAESRRIVADARRGRAVDQGLTVMLSGAPNVGKSLLFNRLLGYSRSIVHGAAGTTRDLVDSRLEIAGVPVRLLDGAGIGPPTGPIDEEGIRRARGALPESDLAIVVLDAGRPLDVGDLEVLELTRGMDRILVRNKCDLAVGRLDAVEVDLSCSALTGAGIDELRDELSARVVRRAGLDGDEGGVVASARALESLEACERSVSAAAAGLESEAASEVLLVDLRDALRALDGTLGLRADEAVLDRIFSAFCVGK